MYRIDIGGIYVLNTNSIQVTDESVDYGVNPILYNELPCECLLLLKVHDSVSSDLPITLAIPYRTTTSNNTINVVDSQNNNVTASNVQSNSERFVYLNKRTGTMRFLEFSN